MPTQPYFKLDGTRVPGVTTIIGRFKDSGALIGWAMKRTRELDIEALRKLCTSRNLTLSDSVLAVSTAPTARDQARSEADAGTICHQWIDDHAYEREKTEYPLSGSVTAEMLRMAENGLGAFKVWWDLHQFNVVQTETPLVSEKYDYGGTLDMLATDRNGELCMLDWKCANAIYNEQYIPQIAAYGQLVEEHGIGTVMHHHLFRAGKVDASGHHHNWNRDTVALGWEAFLTFRKAYKLCKELKKL